MERMWPFKTSQQAYDTLHIGDPEAAKSYKPCLSRKRVNEIFERRIVNVKACVIGMGNIGNTHASVYKECNNVELIGVLTLSRRGRKLLARSVMFPGI